MPALSTRWKLAVVGFLIYAAAAWYFGGDVAGRRTAAAQKKEKSAEGKKAGPDGNKGTPLKKLYFGTAACAGASCHEKGQKAAPPLLCRCDELDRWKEHDKHSEAFKVLRGTRGKQMAKILRYDVTKAKECLACHATVIPDASLQHKTFKYEEGVSCVVCHGPYTRWVPEHSFVITRDAFRVLPRETKEKNYGMTDLWDPIKRARLCSSCHIGNRDQGKFVTHEMYAAGHPPLPGFEIATFSNEMPRHWEYIREKVDAVVKIQKLDKSQFEQTKLVLVGAAVALEESMNLLVAEAKEASRTKGALDLSNFDCYACHHDLKAPSWRQERGYKGKPGRVPMRTWPTELIRLALHHLGDAEHQQEKELDAKLRELHKAFSDQPYGEPVQVQKAAASLASWAKAFAVKLEKTPLKDKDAANLQRLIPQLYSTTGGANRKPRLLDYDSAREVGWAFKTITGELLYDPGDKTSKKADPAIAKALKALNSELYLTLYDSNQKGKTPQIIEPDLEKRLKAVNDYNPYDFRGILTGLSNSLSRKKP